MERVVGAALGAVAGLAFSTMGLVDMRDGLTISSLGGNEATPVVIAVGVAIGALIGSTVLWRFPLAMLGAIIGLAAGMWLRDNAGFPSVQAPWVFLLLFGLPAVGAAGGYALHLPRSRWERRPTLGAVLVGLAAATLSYAVGAGVWASATHDPRCDPTPLPDGGFQVLLCPDPGTPIWIGIVAAVIGASAGIVVHAKLASSETPGSEVVPTS